MSLLIMSLLIMSLLSVGGQPEIGHSDIVSITQRGAYRTVWTRVTVGTRDDDDDENNEAVQRHCANHRPDKADHKCGCCVLNANYNHI